MSSNAKTLLTTLALLAVTGTALPQSGSDQLVATANYFSAGGCTGTRDPEAIFVANVCESIATVLPTVMSVNVTSVNSGCTVNFYTDKTCTQGGTVGIVDHCEQASGPFMAVKVVCPE